MVAGTFQIGNKRAPRPAADVRLGRFQGRGNPHALDQQVPVARFQDRTGRIVAHKEEPRWRNDPPHGLQVDYGIRLPVQTLVHFDQAQRHAESFRTNPDRELVADRQSGTDVRIVLAEQLAQFVPGLVGRLGMKRILVPPVFVDQ